MSKELFVSSTPHETRVAVVEDGQLSEVYYERENEYTLAGSIYKGKVTRVLPGMQSAFVDIGLERDAFLYVSDFFEMGEEEDEEFEPFSTGRPQGNGRDSGRGRPRHEFRRPQNPPLPAPPEVTERDAGESGGEPFVLEGGSLEEGESEAPQQQQPHEGEASESSEQERNGPRPWRRRRRGRRGRGSSESGSDEQQHSSEAKASSPEPANHEHAVPERPAPEKAVPERIAPEKNERLRREYGPPAGYQPMILPGESISKYQHLSKTTRHGQEVPVPSVSSQQPPEPPQSGSGETQHRAQEPQQESPVHGSEYFKAAESAVHGSMPSGMEQATEAGDTSATDSVRGFVAPAPPVETQNVEQTGLGNQIEEDAEAELHWETRAHFYASPVSDREPSQAAPSGSAAPEAHSDAAGGSENEQAEAEPWREHAQESARRTGQTGEAEQSSAPESSMEHLEQSREEPLVGPTISPVSPFTAAPFEHAIEEEEINEEEEDDRVDFSAVAEHLDDLQYEDLEEETFEPGQRAGEGMEGLTEAVEDAEIDREVLDESFEEEDAPAAGWDEESGQQAELREPSSTAPYQQRAEHPDRGYDRRSRNRRGGPRRPMRRPVQRPQVMISDVLKEGQEVLVQIAKEPIGKKGARITSHIALPGRFLVYMPTVNHIGVSRKIASDEERQRLKRIVMGERENGHGGFIVRTAAEGVREDELLADIRFLKHLWEEIRQRTESSRPPALIYHDLNLVERTLRDLVTEDFSHIWVDTEQEYERVLRFVNRFQPSLVRRVRLYTKEMPLYEQFGIQEEINKALKSKVWLKSGGYIVINQTEALVAIDVNTGKYVGKTQRLEDTIVKTNVDAIKEIVRQIRLRDLGGIIVVDFIDMDERKNRQKVMQALEEALTHDRAPSKVLQFNDFGLVAITRKRVKHSLERVLGNPCPYCTGTGLVKSVNTICNEIYIEMKKLRRQFEKDRDILLRVNPEVAKALKINNARWLNEMEELAGKPIIVKPDPLLHQEQFDM
jgi:ribonuclease G